MTIQMMSWRLENLQATIDGFVASGTLLATKVGGAYGKADISDDPGLYLFAAPLGAWLGLDAAQTATLFFLGILAFAVVAGSLGVWRAFGTSPSRGIGIMALGALAVVAAKVGDVYVVSAAVLAAFVPWLLVIVRKCSIRALLVFAALAGLLGGASNLVRSHSGTALAIVALAAFALATWASAKMRVLAAVVLLATMFVAPAGLSLVHRQRDAFLATVEELPPTAASGHPLWHSVYIGLGYVPNDHGITYLDEVAFEFVHKRAPGALPGSRESESILRAEVFRLAAVDPAFVARGVGVKLLAIVGYLLAFANIGLLALILARLPWGELAPLLVGLAFTALPGFLAIPLPNYLTGFIAMSTLLGIVGIDSWFAKRAAQTAVPAES